MACVYSPGCQLIYLCQQAEARNAIVGDIDYGNKVLRISERIVVKCGYGVLLGEPATQKYVYQHLNCRVVRVPQVYRYFQVQDRPGSFWVKGYLFIEFIPGQTSDELDISSAVDITERLANIVSELGRVTARDGIPGPPIGGGRL